jgi:hypothetical protein
VTEQALIPIETVNPVEIFTGGKLDDLLAKIRNYATTIELDAKTDRGRKDIASLAYKIARSKTTLDDAGKSLVADWKKKSAEVDAARKKARDFLDALKDDVRSPLTEWESQQARIAEEARIRELKRQQEAEDARLAEIERREREVREREEAIRRAEEDARAKAEAERLAKEQTEREERIRKEAAERAGREAAQAQERARSAEERVRREAQEARERERLAAEKAERDRVESAERAEREKQEAIRQAEERARKEAEAKEQARLAEERRRREEEERRAADRDHRAKINNAALEALRAEGIGEATAKRIITLIASGAVPRVAINYGGAA